MTANDPLSRRERQILDIPYARGTATAAGVLEALPDPPATPPSGRTGTERRTLMDLELATTDPDPRVREKAIAGLILLGVRK